MQILTLPFNNLTGTLPEEWKSMAGMQSFSMVGNALNGSIPGDVLTSWSGLHEVYLPGNNISGPLPSLPSKIQNLILAGNQLTGTLPSEWGDAQNLTILHLGSNILTGSLPSEFGKLVALNFLDLSQNQLKGSIPSAWAGMTGLKVVKLHDHTSSEEQNSIHGQVPFKACGLEALYV